MRQADDDHSSPCLGAGGGSSLVPHHNPQLFLVAFLGLLFPLQLQGLGPPHVARRRRCQQRVDLLHELGQQDPTPLCLGEHQDDQQDALRGLQPAHLDHDANLRGAKKCVMAGDLRVPGLKVAPRSRPGSS